MADRLDVAERLAEGRPAVEHTQSYVRACRALGYQHPDLTAHPAQLSDLYDSEDGLDLRALDRDCGELRAAGVAVTEALRMQRSQLAELAAAWTGPGGDSAVRMLQRHCDAANAVATELRAAAQRCESLRDNLWYLVDSKVATAIAIDDRTQAQRQAWLAAAAAVTTGAGDRPSAEEVVRQQVMPYVTEDIRSDWLTTMRSTADGVATSYDMVTDRMAAAPPASFELPGDFGPAYQPLQPVKPSTEAAGPAVAPAAAAPSSSEDPAPATNLTTAPPAPVAATPVTPAADWGTALGDASGMPTGELGGGGLSGGGLAGLAGRIVDAIGDLIGSASDELGAENSLDEGPLPADEEPDEKEDVDDIGEVEPNEEGEPVGAATPRDGPPPPVEAPAPAPEPVDVAEPAPPAGRPAPPAGDPAPVAQEGSTPCEIAADQLPQAGQ